MDSVVSNKFWMLGGKAAGEGRAGWSENVGHLQVTREEQGQRVTMTRKQMADREGPPGTPRNLGFALEGSPWELTEGGRSPDVVRDVSVLFMSPLCSPPLGPNCAPWSAALVLNFFPSRPSTVETMKPELTSIMLKGGKIN